MSTETLPAIQKPTRERRISQRVRHAIDLLITGQCRTIKDAASQAGMSRESLSRAMGKAHVQEYRKRRLERAIADLKVASIGTLAALLEGAESEHVRKDIALKIAGAEIAPDTGPMVQVNITPGYVIDLSGGPVISDRSAEQPKPLIDKQDVTDV